MKDGDESVVDELHASRASAALLSLVCLPDEHLDVQ